MKFFQRLGRSLMLPVAVLPVASIFSGLGYWIAGATGDPNNIIGAFLAAAGGALIDNIPLLFAIGVAIGMPKKADGVAALAGLTSWLTVTSLLKPETIMKFQGLSDVAQVDPAFSKVNNVFVALICGLIAAWSFEKFKDTELPDFLAFFSGKRSVAIISALLSLVAALVLMFVWPLVFGGLVAFGEWMLTLGPVGAGLYGFFNRLLIPLGLHHALNAVFWFDIAGVNDLNNFLAGQGTRGVTGQYMTGFFPVMMMGLPGAALAMYVTSKPSKKKATGGILIGAAFAAFLVGITEPLEFLFMFLAPGLYLIHAIFMGISMGVTAALPVRSGFGFSGGFIDLILQWVNPLAMNPWAIFVMGAFWFVVYFLVFRFVILKWNLKTPGRGADEDDDEESDSTATGADKYILTADRFIEALGGKGNIDEVENCATRLRLSLNDVSLADEQALKAAGATGVMKPGGNLYQVIYGLNVQFVKDAMDGLMDGSIESPARAEVESNAAAATVGGSEGSSAAPAATAVAEKTEYALVRMRQPLQGTIVPLEDVPDSTFADRLLGGGVAIDPSGNQVVAPAAGVVSQAFPTGHAVALTLDDGAEVLIHVGLDTVKMNGEGFTVHVKNGDRVAAGQPLVDFDRSAIEAAGYKAITPVVILGHADSRIEFV
ncbi:N-acetylglucosamine-specific PTS transporter subunit IIBC [Dermabacter hominis]|uniref:N-acetylglucosamine-specific PTS transporter subunit IIBC n=1 Tax=Dermabacter hominis TaxID=36740 RepID=UPI0021A3F192|nr:N-acetylglucosamine-specific PTS transporter subunit IIBC [Dermabacter hominis]MCT2055725.1 N-acetylglucosamine-specific PTS transporter subunit IIBC [Dermabacter hominis]MCT2083392.1 N-acetylglucosamine-specific PTS transporter subunit IIBC [Dermabacter hominis]MCT2090644.1 N-acetylglucosamine-specific PTS transporter subunit IIBC [Dermabacter hominis]MCT2190647.1 N-acetylglucosamine-specific PTS transporter subunit IIBC [Dermabacter hominis]MCT2226763.1 N-acetylglucosamine-specific PTS tr